MLDYNKFVIVRVNETETDVCEISVDQRLNDCTDTSAKHTENKYIIHALRPEGLFVSGVMKAYTLTEDRGFP